MVLSQWLYQNMDAVASMYEDRFDLRTLQNQLIQNPINSETEKFSWWKNIGFMKSQPVLSPLRFVVINSISVPVKRTKELRALTGWYVLFIFWLPARILIDLTIKCMPHKSLRSFPLKWPRRNNLSRIFPFINYTTLEELGLLLNIG